MTQVPAQTASQQSDIGTSGCNGERAEQTQREEIRQIREEDSEGRQRTSLLSAERTKNPTRRREGKKKVKETANAMN